MAAEAVLSATLSVLLERSIPKHLGSFIRGRDVEKDLNKLKKTVMKIDQVMNDAENKQFKTSSVKIWLEELRDAAYDAEDVIEEFAMEAQRMKLKLEADQSPTSTTSLFASISTSVSTLSSEIASSIFSSELESKIKEITERFSDLAQERFELGLEEIKVAASWSSISSDHAVFRETSSLPGNYPVLGRDVDKAKIIDLLTSSLSSSSSCGNELIVVPIVGMGGVGKTTLAQLVYNDNSLKDHHFNSKAWVCVSPVEFDVKVITRTILDQFPGTYQNSHSSDLNQLQVGLQKALTGKKFLIVLDDVWNKDYSLWDDLRKPFGVGAPGSAIIITTRDIEIGSNMGTVGNHYLNKLSEDDCWSVFVQHAFWKRNVDACPDLVVIGKGIAMKCDGLPLAAKSLGGLLRAKEEVEWENVLNSKMWDLEEDGINILTVLKLSYYYLPSYLKRCFAYCSIFPKDYRIEEEKLVQLWMAEGFLEQPNGKMERLEDIGRKCFRVLLSRSFFQPSSTSESFYVMHHLMSDLAQWAAGQTCLRIEDSWDRRRQCIKARHLSYSCGQYCEVQKFEDLYGVEFLRTFLRLDIQKWYKNEILTSGSLLKMRFLRVLSLPRSDIKELPSSIGGDLKHLRYIDVSYTEIRSIPDSVCTLYNLQSLLLKGCSNLKKLPEELKILVNLRHLDISPRMEVMPPQIGRLTSLRTLSDFVVGKDSRCGIEELESLRHLEGTLRISKLENVIDAELAKAANLSDKKGLDVLKMEWHSQIGNPRNESIENEVLDKLRPPHEKLKELSIICYGGVSFPTWVGEATFSSMVVVELRGCEKCTHLPPLGQLSFLKYLFIGRMNGVVTVGPEFYGAGRSNPFPSLVTLSFVDMKEWREWLPCDVEMRDNLFALLQKLLLVDCPNLLGSLPDHLPSLEIFEVKGCKALQSVSEAISGHSCNNSSLENLRIESCDSLTSIARSSLLFSRVKELMINFCPSLQYLMEADAEGSSSSSLCYEMPDSSNTRPSILKFLYIWNCPSLTSLFSSSSSSRGELPATLERLEIHKCPKLESLGERFHSNPSLDQIKIFGCESLKYLPENLHSLTRLSCFYMYNCPSLVRFPDGGLPVANLRSFEIDKCEKLEALPNRMHNLTSLQSLTIRNCPAIVSFFFPQEEEEEEDGFPTNITALGIGGPNICKAFFQWGLHRLNFLRELRVEDGCLPDQVSFPAEAEAEAEAKAKAEGEEISMVLPNSLIELTICNFPNLESLSSKGFQNLTSLEDLFIMHCPKLQYFPENGLPPSLKDLTINDCTLLEQRCERDQGQEWSKISHIPRIIIHLTRPKSPAV